MSSQTTNYLEALSQSYRKTGNNICLGLDPQWHKLPKLYRKQIVLTDMAPQPDCMALQDFLEISLQSLQKQGFVPAAFKPNLGYFQVMDRPLLAAGSNAETKAQQAFSGSLLLAWLHKYLSQNFPGIPIILDFKKGDIAYSSANYSQEGFACWGSDALTVHPYMGSDSIAPFGLNLQKFLAKTKTEFTNPFPISSLSCKLPLGSGGVYSLLRTSNPGSKDLQNLPLKTNNPLYITLAETLLRWRNQFEIPGMGAVVGATSTVELRQLAKFFSNQSFPLLIPGVGRQGGSFQEVLQTLRETDYPLDFVRINLSSGLLQSWEENVEPPLDWSDCICRKFAQLQEYFH